jgi:hypothetical protein
LNLPTDVNPKHTERPKEKHNKIVKIFHMNNHHGSKILKTPSGALPAEESRRRPRDNTTLGEKLRRLKDT